MMRKKGESFKIPCYTVFVLNKKSFNLLYSYYHHFRSQTDTLLNFFEKSDYYLFVYQRRIEQQDEEFKTMQGYFHSISDSSRKLADSTSLRLGVIKGNLDSIQQRILLAKDNIESAQQNLLRIERDTWMTRVFIGLGGFALGGLIISLAK
jgi:hypothetical protein